MSGARLRAPATFEGTLTLPGSKSHTNRALIAAALARGKSEIANASLSEDTRLLAGALIRHGIAVKLDEARQIISIEGGDKTGDRNAFYLGNAGTSVRFFTAYLALQRGNFVIDGDLRMRQRPLGPLIDALNRLGGDVTSVHGTGCPPVALRANGLRGGKISIQADVSSQFVSAILLAAPYCAQGVELIPEQEPTSRGYIEMTRAIMRNFGVEVSGLSVQPGQYTAARVISEPDAAAANYFFAMAAVTGGRIRVEGLGARSGQAERKFVDVLRRMGCRVEESETYTEVFGGALRGVDVDLNEAPDSAQTLAVTALFARGPTVIRNVANLKVKETDRLRALAVELAKLGARVEERADGLVIEPPKKVTPADIASYSDHRMVMSFAAAALREPGIALENPECVSKSFPEFFDVLRKLGVEVSR